MRDPLPDLVVERLLVAPNGVQVTIKNQGTRAVTSGFWVDVYLNPSSPPTQVNQPWWSLSSEGLVWGVSGAALPLQPGQSLTLTINDSYYQPAYSTFSESIPAGTPVYAQVDSANLNSSYGGVLESHEVSGAPYNNIAGPAFPGQQAMETVEAAERNIPRPGALPAR
jgi:hypothetical protein